MTGRQMILGGMLGSSYGALANDWRAPGVDPYNFTSTDAHVRVARAGERGGFSFMFLQDFAAVRHGRLRRRRRPDPARSWHIPPQYAGDTLRDNLGLPEQYGFDPRLQVSSTADSSRSATSGVPRRQPNPDSHQPRPSPLPRHPSVRPEQSETAS